MIGHPKHSGVNSSTGNSEQRANGARKYQTKPMSSNPWGINGLQFWFRSRGTPGSARRDGSLHRVTVHLRLSAGDPREQPRATTIEGRGTTERQNYQTNQISHNPHRFSILLPISEMPGSREGPGGVHRAGLAPFAGPSGFAPPRRYGSLCSADVAPFQTRNVDLAFEIRGLWRRLAHNR